MQRLVALGLAVLMIVSVGCGGSKSASIPKGDPKMLSFSITDINGKTLDMRQHLGKVVIVDFWDTWCGPCRKGIPEFVELYTQYKPKGLEVVGVALARQGNQAVKEFSQSFKINYTSGIANEETSKLFGMPSSIPTTYIIAPDGSVAEKVVGYRPKAYFEEKIKSLLKLS